MNIDIGKFDAILWDMDGVIVDSENIWKIVEPYWITTTFPKFTKNDCHQFMGQSPRGVFNILQRKYKNLQWDEFFVQQEQLALQKVYPYAKIFQGIPEVLERFSTTHKQAISSSALKSWIDAVVDKNNLKPFFQQIVSSQDVKGASKPDPRIFIHTAKLLKTSPEKCLVIEDSPNGILAGKRAGMTVWGYQSESNKNHDLSGADFLFSDFEELSIS